MERSLVAETGEKHYLKYPRPKKSVKTPLLAVQQNFTYGPPKNSQVGSFERPVDTSSYDNRSIMIVCDTLR